MLLVWVDSGAWKNSVMREQVSYDLRYYLDDQDRSGFKHTLKILRDISSQYGLDIAITSMQEASYMRHYVIFKIDNS